MFLYYHAQFQMNFEIICNHIKFNTIGCDVSSPVLSLALACILGAWTDIQYADLCMNTYFYVRLCVSVYRFKALHPCLSTDVDSGDVIAAGPYYVWS